MVVAAAGDTCLVYSMDFESGEMKRETEFKADFCSEEAQIVPP